MINKYMRELSNIKTWDSVQGIETLSNGMEFIDTAGHGYLVVPNEHALIEEAKKIVKFGFEGIHAVYLEEDCEAPEFLKILKGGTK